MIVTPDFAEHWKTRLLVDITKDESAPMAVIRGWGHCQTSRRWEFPDMTPRQLASICRWGTRKPACHVALVKAGFIDRLEKGFAFHDWQESNAQLIQKWNAGKKGGRPPHEETDRFPPVSRTRTDRLDQTDQTDQRDLKESHATDAPVTNGGAKAGKAGISEVNGLVAGLVSQKSVLQLNAPTLQMVKAEMELQFKGGGRFAEAWIKSKTAAGWKDNNGQRINDWRPLAKAYASACEARQRGVTKR